MTVHTPAPCKKRKQRGTPDVFMVKMAAQEVGHPAREGHKVVQFRDIQTNKYLAVAIDGKVQEYGQRNG